MSLEEIEKDCTNCPSFLGVADARKFFGVPSISVPMCARFGKLLAVPAKDEAEATPDGRVCVETAQSCKYFGATAPTSPDGLPFHPVIFFPDTKALEKVTSDADTRASDCRDCVNCFFAPKLGVHGCKPQGRVIFGERVHVEPQGCSWSRLNEGSLEFVDKPRLMNPYSEVKVEVKKKPEVFAAVMDPTSFESDAPVSEADREMIQAWRKVVVPGSAKEYFIPVFRTEFFSEEDRELIPKAGDPNDDPSLYVDHTGLLAKFVTVSYKRDMQLCYIGEPGSGKTTGVRYLAWLMNMPFRRLQYNEYSEPEQVLGMIGIKGGDTGLEPGLLPTGWTSIGHLLSDEYNLPQEGIQQVYREMLDNSRELTIYGRKFRRHYYCFHHMAINPSWDYRNIGAKEMASADVRRLTFHWMTMPDRATCQAIIAKALKNVDGETLPTAKMKAILDVSEDLREMVKQGKLPHHWTLSQDIKVARLAVDWPLKEAYKIAYFDYLDPQTAEVALAAVASRLPMGV